MKSSKSNNKTSVTTIFMLFVKPFCHGAYESYNFSRLADNGLFGCTLVVAMSFDQYVSRRLAGTFPLKLIQTMARIGW
jgi:hypothetical protein